MKNVSIIDSPINPVIIGLILGAYGVKGWVKVFSFTVRISDIFKYHPWFIFFSSQWKLMELECWKVMQKRCIVKFLNFSNRECAKLLSQHKLFVDNSVLSSLCESDDYYWKDIIGCTVMTVCGKFLGIVKYILENPIHDVLVIEIDKNDFSNIRDYFIPFIFKKIVKNIDLIEKIIVVDWKN